MQSIGSELTDKKKKTPQQRLGQNIRVCRLILGMTQKELALSVGLSREAIGQIELGRQTLPAEYLPILASVLQADPVALVESVFRPSVLLQ